VIIEEGFASELGPDLLRVGVLFVCYPFSGQLREELFFGRELYLGEPSKAVYVFVRINPFLREQLSLFDVFISFFLLFFMSSDVSLCVVRDAAYFSLHPRHGMHQEMTVVSLQVVKDHWNGRFGV